VSKDEVVVACRGLEGLCRCVAGPGDGQVLFERTVVLAGAQANEARAQEINPRSITPHTSVTHRRAHRATATGEHDKAK